MSDDWMKNPALSGIDPAKLAMLQSFAAQGNGKSPNDLMSLLLSASSSSKEQGLQFSRSETELITEVLMAGKSPQEKARIQKMLSMLRMMQRRR